MSLILVGCKATYQDISEDVEVAHYVGEKYELLSDMDFSGVNAPPGYSDEINYYVISSRDPGWSGPEVITRETLAKGTIITIRNVSECTNCLTFGAPLRHILVTIDNSTKPTNLLIKQICGLF